MPRNRDNSRDHLSIYRKAIVILKALATILTLIITALLYLLIFKLNKGISNQLLVPNATFIEPYSKINSNTNSMQRIIYYIIFSSIESFLEKFFIIAIFFAKIQLLVQSIGLYAALMDKKELIKLIGSGILMAGFAFINYLSMTLFTIFDQNAIVLNSSSYFNSIIYTSMCLIVIQLILFSLASNIEKMGQDFNVKLHFNFKIVLMVIQSLIIAVTVGLHVLLYVFLVKLDEKIKNSDKSDTSEYQFYSKTEKLFNNSTKNSSFYQIIFIYRIFNSNNRFITTFSILISFVWIIRCFPKERKTDCIDRCSKCWIGPHLHLSISLLGTFSFDYCWN